MKRAFASALIAAVLACMAVVPTLAREKHPSVQAHNGEVVRIAVVPQREFMVSAGADGVVKLWSFPDLVESRGLMSFDNGVTGMAMSHDGYRVAASDAKSKLGLVWLWGKEAKEPPLKTVIEKQDVAMDLLFLPNDSSVLALMLNLTQTGPAVRSFNGRTLESESWFQGKMAAGANAFDLDATGELLSATTDPGNVVRWKIPQPMPARYPAVKKKPVAVASSPDGKAVYFGDAAGGLYVITEARKEPVRLWDAKQPIGAVAVDAKGEWIAIATSGRTRREVYQRTSLSRPYARPTGPSMPILVMPVSLYLSGGGDGLPPADKVIALDGPIGGSLSVCFSGDGKHVAAGGNDGMLHAWWIVEDRQRVTR